MRPLGVALVFEPLSWAAGLPFAAGLVLIVEAISLRTATPSRSRRTLWILLPAACVGGALAAWLWAGWIGHATPLSRPLAGSPSPLSRVMLLGASAMVAAACLLGAFAIVERLALALAGRIAGTSVLTGLLRGGLLAGLAGLTILWVPHGAVVAVGVATAAWAVRSYRRTTSPVGRLTKAMLLAVRVAAVLLLLAWALRPALEYRRQEEVPTIVLFCVDTSASMQRRDANVPDPATRPAGDAPLGAAEPLSRIEAVRRVLQASDPAFAELGRQADVQLVPFAAGASTPERYLSRIGWTLLSLRSADGAATALGDALSEARDRCADQEREVSAVILVSDGCNNTSDVIAPDRLAALLGAQGVPLHTVGVGSDRVTSATQTLTVRDLTVPDEVEAFNRLSITAGVEAIGLEGKQVKVTCRFGEDQVGTRTFTLGDARQTLPVRFVHVPLVPGFHRLSLAAEVVGEELPDLAGQPGAAKLVRVVDREMRILYVEGKFRYEAKYVARALAAARRFSVDRRVLLQPLAEKQPPPLSENLDDWLAYHAVIFGDVAASRFTRKQLAIVRDLVAEYGKGFCMLGGSKSFGRGGWSDTPVADVLPINVRRSASQIDTPIRVVPTDEARRSDVMRISDAGLDVAADWAGLDPLPGANRLAGLKPAATVLARTPGGEPLIVTQPYGKGRSMAIAFDTTWRWVLTKKDTAELQRRFWRQVALYLAAPKGRAWIATDQTTYDLRRLRRGTEAVKVSAGVEDAQGRPLLTVPVEVRLRDRDGRETRIPLAVGNKLRTGRVPPPRLPGLYKLTLTATVDGKRLTAEHRFEVAERELESLEVLANHSLLRRMAALANGRFVTLDQFGALLRDLKVAARPERRETVTHVSFTSGLPRRWLVALALGLVALIVGLMCLEWSARKRKGLV
jgi:uncharacterized membrane protein